MGVARRTGIVGAVVLALSAHGGASAEDRVRIETPRAVLEYQRGSLGDGAARAFADLLDRGIGDIESLVGPSLPPEKRRQGPVRFVATERVEIAHAFRHTVMLPLDRVRSQSAPYLHESVHVLVPSSNDCAWLSEGLASYLESRVSEELGGYDAHIFSRAGNKGIDAAARRYLEREQGLKVLPWVGTCAAPPGLEADRRGVAAPFYVLSQSLVKYVSEQAGLGPLVSAALDSAPDATLARLTRRSLDRWKQDWLAALGATARAPQPVALSSGSNCRMPRRNA